MQVDATLPRVVSSGKASVWCREPQPLAWRPTTATVIQFDDHVRLVRGRPSPSWDSLPTRLTKKQKATVDQANKSAGRHRSSSGWIFTAP
jgi:hypothetical protein